MECIWSKQPKIKHGYFSDLNRDIEDHFPFPTGYSAFFKNLSFSLDFSFYCLKM